MNWIKDFIPQLREISLKHLVMIKIIKYQKGYGDHVTTVDPFSIYPNSKKIHMFVQSVLIISKSMYLKELKLPLIKIHIKA